MCPYPTRCEKFALGLYFLAHSGWRRYVLLSGAAPEGSGETEPPTQRPGEAEPSTQRSGEAGAPTQRSGEAEPAHLGGWTRRSPRTWEAGRGGAPDLEVGRGGARPQRSGEAEPTHQGSVGAVVALLIARTNQC